MNANSLYRLSTDAGIPDTGVMVITPDEWQPPGSSCEWSLHAEATAREVGLAHREV
jgi:hypothetical protein